METLQDTERASLRVRVRSSRLALDGVPRPATTARQHARTMLTGWALPRSLAQDTLVVVSELVTNAELHTETGPTQLLLLQQDGCLLVRVHDRSTMPIRCREADAEEERGRGLHIVRSLAAAFGSDCETSGKSVWAWLAAAG